jgi:hypothetical protein
VVVALGEAGLALGAQAGLKRFAKASASGDEAIVQAAGTAKHPQRRLREVDRKTGTEGVASLVDGLRNRWRRRVEVGSQRRYQRPVHSPVEDAVEEIA